MRLDFDTFLTLFFFVVFIVLPLVTRSRSKQQPGRPDASRRPPGQGTARPSQAPGRAATGQAGTGPGGRPTGTPSTLGRAPTASTSAGGAQSGAQGSASTSSRPPSDSPLAMLEEIRRRVQEAQERERAAGRGAGGAPQAGTASATGPAAGSPSAPSGAASSTPSRTATSGRPLVASDPFERGLVGGSAERSAPPSALGREGAQRSEVPRRAAAPPSLARTRSVIEGADTPAARRTSGAQAAARRSGGALGARLGALGLDRMDRDTILHGLIWHEILDEPTAFRRLRRQRSRPL